MNARRSFLSIQKLDSRLLRDFLSGLAVTVVGGLVLAVVLGQWPNSGSPSGSVTLAPATPLPTPAAPRIVDIQFCPGECNGSNSTRTFPVGTTKIYLQWRYEHIPVGATYERIWSNDGKEWVHYLCVWPGPESGVVRFPVQSPLSEPAGLHSGVWTVTMLVDGQAILSEQVTIEGNVTVWKPAGVIERCFGKASSWTQVWAKVS
jgi:hypothetical protein